MTPSNPWIESPTGASQPAEVTTVLVDQAKARLPLERCCKLQRRPSTFSAYFCMSLVSCLPICTHTHIHILSGLSRHTLSITRGFITAKSKVPAIRSATLCMAFICAGARLLVTCKQADWRRIGLTCFNQSGESRQERTALRRILGAGEPRVRRSGAN